MIEHNPNCDVNDANPDGIKKPCNCGMREVNEWDQHRKEVEGIVCLERIAQYKKWGVQSHDLGTWLAILTEEVGEMSQAMLSLKFDAPIAPRVWHVPQIEKEAVQVAAVASAIVQMLRHGSA